jgi:hypothetical protein
LLQRNAAAPSQASGAVDAYVRSVRNRVIWIALLLAGCNRHPHVQLGPLPTNMSTGQRVQIYNDLHATAERETTTTSCSNQGGCSSSIHRTLFLANGTEVHHAEDLLPLLSPDSHAARSAQASLRSQQNQRNFTLLGVAGMVVVAIVGMSILSDDDGDGELSSGVKLGLVAGGATALVGSFGAYHYHTKAADEQGEANTHYNAGLARRLDVCVSGIYVVPCEATAATITPGGP